MTTEGATPRRPLALVWLVVCFLLALVIRLPVLALPLEGDGARLATRGGLMGHEEAFFLEDMDSRGPLLPMLLAVPIRSGATPTGALRGLDVLLGGCLAALAALVASRVGLNRRAAAFVGLLTAVHPALAVHAGGALAGTASLSTVLFLTGLLLASSSGVRRRRTAAVVAAVLPLADPLTVMLAAALLVTWFRRESSLRARTILSGLFVLLLVFTPVPVLGSGTGLGTRLLALVLQWLPVAGLLALLPAVPRGVGVLAASESRGPALAWMVGGALHLLLLVALPFAQGFAFGADAAAAAAPIVPLVLTLGVAGVGSLAAPWPTRLRRAALGVAAAGALFAVLGPVQTFLLPRAPAAAGRLHRLARAVDAAAEAAGPTGWVAFDLDARLDPLEIDRLADRVPDRPVGRLPRHDPDADPEGTLPLDELPREVPVGVVTSYRPEVLGVTTFAGGGIYTQEPTARFGPWLVLRAVRP